MDVALCACMCVCVRARLHGLRMFICSFVVRGNRAATV
jgi:hypothetical protein